VAGYWWTEEGCSVCHDKIWTQAELDLARATREAELGAWHTVFGTTQLTHAEARLRAAEDKAERATEQLAALRRKGDAMADALAALPEAKRTAFASAALAAWNAPAPSGDTAHDVLLAAYDVLTVAPELSPSDYDHDEVCELNSKALEAWSILDAYVNPKNAPASLPYDPTAGTTTMPAPECPTCPDRATCKAVCEICHGHACGSNDDPCSNCGGAGRTGECPKGGGNG
jgi:hypothetical protein